MRLGSRSPDEAQRRDHEAGAGEYDPDHPLHEPEFERGQGSIQLVSRHERGQVGFRRKPAFLTT